MQRFYPLVAVVNEAMKHTKVPAEDFFGRTRYGRGLRKHPEAVEARELAVAVARRVTLAGYPEIATAVGYRAHSAAVEADHRCRGRGEEWDRKVAAVISGLGGGA